MRGGLAEQARRILHRPRACFGEQCIVKRHQPVLNGDRLVDAAALPRNVHLAAQSWRHIRRDADAAVAAGGKEGQRRVILARQLAKARPAETPRVQRTRQIRRRILHADDVAVLRQTRHRFHAHVHHAARRDVVDDDWQVDRIGDGGEVQVKPFLRRLVVVGRHDERRIRAGLLGMARQVDRLGRAVRSGAGDHRHAPARDGNRDLHNPLVLGMRQRRRLAGGAHRDHAVRALVDLPIDERGIGILVHRAVGPHRRHQCNQRSLEHEAIPPPHADRRGQAGVFIPDHHREPTKLGARGVRRKVAMP